MKRIFRLAAAAACVALVAVPVALGDNDPFPAAKSGQVFLSVQTVTPDGAVLNSFAPGSTVIFRAYAVDAKTNAAVAKTAVRYFYATIPNQPNVKFAFTPGAAGSSGPYAWTG